jgi:hypothetical protein
MLFNLVQGNLPLIWINFSCSCSCLAVPSFLQTSDAIRQRVSAARPNVPCGTYQLRSPYRGAVKKFMSQEESGHCLLQPYISCQATVDWWLVASVMLLAIVAHHLECLPILQEFLFHLFYDFYGLIRHWPLLTAYVILRFQFPIGKSKAMLHSVQWEVTSLLIMSRKGNH